MSRFLALRLAPATATVIATVAVAAVLFPATASAHALIGKQDLPLPQWLFIRGAW